MVGMNWIKRLIDGLISTKWMANTAKVYSRVLYGVAFLLGMWMMPIADQVWGLDYFVIIDHGYSGFKRFAVLLREPFFRGYYEWFLFPFLLLTLLGSIGLSRWWSRLLIWALFVNLNFANYATSNGGWHLLQALLFLSIFISNREFKSNSKRASVDALLHNLGFGFSWIQVVILYLTAGVHKLLGFHWLQGDALFLTLSFPEYSIPLIFENFKINAWYFKVANWIALFYQLCFAVFIWVRSIRPYFLVVGLIFHISIAFVVGVLDFGLILVAVYTMFLPNQYAEKWLQWFDPKRLRKWIADKNTISGIGD